MEFYSLSLLFSLFTIQSVRRSVADSPSLEIFAAVYCAKLFIQMSGITGCLSRSPDNNSRSNGFNEEVFK